MDRSVKYILSSNAKIAELREAAGTAPMILVADSGGKSLYTNLALAAAH